MMRSDPAWRSQLRTPLGVSVAVHAVFATVMFLLSRGSPSIVRPPMYRVDLVAAPAGPRALGVVRPAPAERPPTPSPLPPRPQRVAPPDPLPPAPVRAPETRSPPPATTPAPATPNTSRPTPPPIAGGGPTGARGTDVATVRTEGIEFPYSGYKDNIIRQVVLRFHAPPNVVTRAEILFLIRRDGSVTGMRFVSRSGNYAFDLEAQGAIEDAGNSRAFGPLPDGFTDDVLPVIFSFDPRVLR
ncbi:MAG: TonB C-terminal domain-containing protein [Gemmatimonadota bacterium]|nr:TonB C-terminal domain-containing protein [Gemmatimonadota bacterium]MDQ6888252.1 TonB C-terminal domain-containing protein [Gemmatimonadota bacterium]